MTMDEIAKSLGVSKSTVSRALSGKGRIGKNKRQEIIEFAKQNGITVTEEKTVSSSAKKISPENNNESPIITRNLGVVFPSDVYFNGSPFFYECLLGIYEAASLMDYNVIVTTAAANDMTGIQKLLDEKHIDGLILTRNMEDEHFLKQLTDRHFPVGLTGRCENPDVIQVDADNSLAAENLVSLLVGEGYRKFAIVTDNMTFMVNQARYEGFCRGILKSGLSRDNQEFYSGKLSSELLETVMDDVMAKKVECVICGDDVICTKLMSKFQSAGYRIPKDIAIASLYNSYSLECFTPTITSVNISARTMGNMIGRQLIQYIQGASVPVKTFLDYEILLRKSTGRKKN
ncbi:MAG: LacI family transcriptional regulator [Lachnospiraceae bacterium]|nr:LacI family transcriptional regulator [Lachnospiraceae bacterium]